jgi:rhodanese-related sulfurtransferase
MNPRSYVDIPMKQLLLDPIGQLRSHTAFTRGSDLSPSASSSAMASPVPDEIYLVCRRGNDSLISAQALRRALDEEQGKMRSGGETGCKVMDVRGGVRAWSLTVDPGFPMY